MLDRKQDGAEREAWQQDSLPLSMALAVDLCRAMNFQKPLFQGCSSWLGASWLNVMLEYSTGCKLPDELPHCKETWLSLAKQYQQGGRGKRE